MEIDKLLPDANALLGLKIALFTNSERAQDFLKGVYLIPSTWDIIVKELGATTNAWNNKQVSTVPCSRTFLCADTP